MLQYARIRAPFAGVVTARMADPRRTGRSRRAAAPSRSAGPLQLQATVDESAIAAVHMGMKRSRRCRWRGLRRCERHSGRNRSRRRSVQSHFPRQDFAPSVETTARGHVWDRRNPERYAPSDRRAAFGHRCPRLACRVLTLSRRDGIAQLRYVTTGAAHGSLVEVLSGISAGEKLVDNPADRELAGKRINASNDASNEVQQ